MKAFRILTVPAALLLTLATPAAAQDMDTPTVDPLPFEVSVGGHAAETREGIENVAVIIETVPPTAEVQVEDVEGQVIANVFPSDPEGQPVPGAQPVILLFDASESKALDQNMGGTTLEDGFHLMSIMAAGKTARVVIQVQSE